MEDVVTDSLAEPVLLHNTEWLPKHLRAHQQKTGGPLPRPVIYIMNREAALTDLASPAMSPHCLAVQDTDACVTMQHDFCGCSLWHRTVSAIWLQLPVAACSVLVSPGCLPAVGLIVCPRGWYKAARDQEVIQQWPCNLFPAGEAMYAHAGIVAAAAAIFRDMEAHGLLYRLLDGASAGAGLPPAGQPQSAAASLRQAAKAAKGHFVSEELQDHLDCKGWQLVLTGELSLLA